MENDDETGEKEEFNFDFNDGQDDSQNRKAEDLVESQENPAQLDEIQSPKQPVKVGYPGNLNSFLRKFEDQINTGMDNCNEIKRTTMPVLKKGLFIRDNIEDLIAKKGERAIIYEFASIISQMDSAFNIIDGRTMNIKFALIRSQELVDSMKEEKDEDGL